MFDSINVESQGTSYWDNHILNDKNFKLEI